MNTLISIHNAVFNRLERLTQPWLLPTLARLVFAGVFVACRYKHVRKRNRHRAEVERITAELKDTPAATDV